MLGEDRGPAARKFGVHPTGKHVRELRRLGPGKPLLHALKRAAIQSGWRGARTEGGGAVALADAGVVTVPVELHANLLFLQPDCGKIDNTYSLRFRHSLEVPVEQGLG